MKNKIKKLSEIGIVPVIKIDDAAKAAPLAKALMEGGIPAAEVTFRTAEAAQAIRRMTSEAPDILVGAGTVLTIDQAKQAVDAGAQFIVSPGFNRSVVEYCKQCDILIIPGCATPTDMERAIELGLNTVKFFPAEQAGGTQYLKAVSAPYQNLEFMPTGGITEANLNDYLSFDKVIACGGSWMVKPELIASGQYDEITRLCKKAVDHMLGFELLHIGINEEDAESALSAAKLFESLFSFTVRDDEKGVFADKYIEVMKGKGFGKNGHIAVGTHSVSRAKAYLERRGTTFIVETAKYDDRGNLKLIYLKDEICGFAIHLNIK